MVPSRILLIISIHFGFNNVAVCNVNEDCLCRNINAKDIPVTKITNAFCNYSISNYHELSELTTSNVIVNNFNNCEARIDAHAYAENYLPQIGDQEKGEQYHLGLSHLTDFLFTSLPPFDMSLTEGVSHKCKAHSQQYIKGLRELKIWTLKMYDANAKVPSGILSGNINQLGDFDLCLEVKSDDLLIKGQYCLAYLQVKAHTDPYINSIYKLVYSYSPFKSNLNDPGHRVPRYSSINWALCVPDSCTAQDVELGLRQSVIKIFNETDLEVQLKVEPTMCQKLETRPLPSSTVFAMAFFMVIVFVAMVSTLYDFYKVDTKNELLVAFSLKKNLTTLTSTARSPHDIQAIHGVRFINALILVFAHKSLALFFIPYMNRTEMSKITGQPWTVLGRAASLYTDPFIMIAGTLTAYSLYSKLQRTNKINIFQEYTSRMFRIIPSLAALIMFCTYVLPWLNSGPQWNLVVTHHSNICKKYWWRNLLFIHNYFGFKDMCLTHTHHIGIDTQLFLLSPLMVFLIWKWPKRGIVLLTIWAIISTVMRYYVTYTQRLSNYIHYGTSIQQLFSTADNMYILPSHRVTVYVMGILLGCSLQHYRKVQLSSFQLFLGNTIALLSFSSSLIGPAFMGDITYIYRPVDAACYAAFAPILWCMSFAWVIFTTHYGYLNSLGKLFSWKGFRIWTKISYAVYLTQFPIFFYNVGVTRTSDYYGFFSKNFNFGECLWICILSALLTILFELPFQNIRNIMLRKIPETAKQKNNIQQH